MSAAPRPDNDLLRIAALDATGVMARADEPRLRELAAEAARVARAPMGIVSFVTAEQQWIKAAVGIDLTSTPRDAAFCAWAIYSADLLWVEDALADVRFADNPLVCQHPHIRHYVGAPIMTPDGFALGAICALDSRPHAFDCDIAPALTQLAEEVSRTLGVMAPAAGAQRVRAS